MKSNSSLVAYCDDLNEFNWFIELDHQLQGARFKKIQRRGRNPLIIDELVKYDRPDVILLLNDRPKLVIEKTSEVPTGHNVGQRMARLVRAVELGVPTIYFAPFRGRKQGRYTSICDLNARLLLAFDSMWRIHEVPIMAVNWPCDANGSLITDSSAEAELKELVKRYIDSGFNLSRTMFASKRQSQIDEYNRRIELFKPYASPPKTVTCSSTDVFFQNNENRTIIGGMSKAMTRRESVVYEISMTVAGCKRQDPYTGMQFVYDYLYCREGVEIDKKHRNLILSFPNLTHSVWIENNPNDSNTKSSNWYLTADLMLFSDAIVACR